MPVRINSQDKARLTVDEVAIKALTRRYESNFKVFKRINDDDYVKKRVLDWIFDEVLRDQQRPQSPTQNRALSSAAPDALQ